MRFENYINESDLINEGIFVDVLKKIKNKSSDYVKKLFKKSWENFSKIIKDNDIESDVLKVINKHLKTNYKSLEQLDKLKLTEDKLNEDFAHYWHLLKQEAFPTLAFWPALKIWLEIDKLFGKSGVDVVNVKMIVVYAIFWLLLVSGKYIKAWAAWKKENPEEYAKEKMAKA